MKRFQLFVRKNRSTLPVFRIRRICPVATPSQGTLPRVKPVFWCARGTTSLESFHLHLVRYLILVFLWGILFIAIQHPLLHSSQDQEGVNMHEEWERGKVFMSVLTESEGLEVFCPIHGHGINHKVNCFGWSKHFMHFTVSVDLYQVLQGQAGTVIPVVH